jgi:hypothetical protein
MNDWQPIETAPTDGTPFLGAETVKRGDKMGGVTLRAALRFPNHQFEQQVDGEWWPAFVRPKFWKPATERTR